MRRFKKGAASFYIVAFSTLILMIVAISFAAVIISEVERTSNDDLSQSAYDSALAGIEDAKLAYYNYQNCIENGGGGSCNNVIEIMEKGEYCEMVWEMLGRGTGDVVESNTGNNMEQYTTCVTMKDELPNYMGTLSASSVMDVIMPKFEDDTYAQSIDKIKLKWYTQDDKTKSGVHFASNSKKFEAAPVSMIAPPVISFAVLQTGPDFTMESFNEVGSNNTNRGMVYLIPSASGGDNEVGSGELIKSNSKQRENTPHTVKCNSNDEYICETTINLPKPIGGNRNPDTFQVIVSMPYGQPSTKFMLEFYCENGSVCATKEISDDAGNVTRESTTATLKGVQLEVDSTGRANDLFRRVVARLKNRNSDLALTVMGPLELLGNSGDESPNLKKDLTVTCEANFPDKGNCK